MKKFRKNKISNTCQSYIETLFYLPQSLLNTQILQYKTQKPPKVYPLDSPATDQNPQQHQSKPELELKKKTKTKQKQKQNKNKTKTKQNKIQSKKITIPKSPTDFFPNFIFTSSITEAEEHPNDSLIISEVPKQNINIYPAQKNLEQFERDS